MSTRSTRGTTRARPSRLGARLACVGGLATVVLGCTLSEPAPTRGAPSSSAAAAATVELRSPYWPTYPCTQCHEHAPGTANPKPRELRAFHGTRHDLEHGSLTGWCYRCHAQANLDWLVLDDGRTVGFEQSHLLCGSCHGEKLADWRNGIHGQTTGMWNGARVRSICVRCHDPHRPKIGPMRAEPAPAPPRTELPRPGEAT